MTTRTRITAGIATGLIAAVLVPAAAVGYTDTGTPSCRRWQRFDLRPQAAAFR